MPRPDAFDGLELRSFGWRAEALAVERVESSFFEDRMKFPSGSAELDCALLMKGIDHEWHGRRWLGTDGRMRGQRADC
jgi:hypothetical protein